MDVQVKVPLRHQGITTGSDVPEAVALPGAVADLHPLRMIDADRPGALFPLATFERRGIAHGTQDTEAASCPPRKDHRLQPRISIKAGCVTGALNR